ncbi:hypothetical protein ET532_023840 [Verminephrobacter sp. Larva24]|nr:hypothetical protein ET532_023840 [Verminephrobacter sp. Larva24]
MAVAEQLHFDVARRFDEFFQKQAGVVEVGARQVRDAGTVEFVLDAASQQFYFLEVNTRLQVEHGVTEQVTGIDLVRAMVQLAQRACGDGFPMPLPTPRGAAIEVRLYAEDPARNFQPSAGLLTDVHFAPEARTETWVASGSQVSAHYDPLLAKLIDVTPGIHGL